MRAFFLLLTVAVTGCAGMEAAECRGANWYDLGFRDAIFGIQPQHDLYEPQCARHGVALDRARYVEGWLDGDFEFHHRKNESVD